jgi:hypothetical protein
MPREQWKMCLSNLILGGYYYVNTYTKKWVETYDAFYYMQYAVKLSNTDRLWSTQRVEAEGRENRRLLIVR